MYQTGMYQASMYQACMYQAGIKLAVMLAFATPKDTMPQILCI